MAGVRAALPHEDRGAIKDFSLQVENLVKQETDAWILEFQSSISELEKTLKTEVETRKPGSIKVVVTNARDFDRVTIQLDDNQVKEFVDVTEGVVGTIYPGSYEVVAIRKKDGRETKGSKVVEVLPSSMASAELTLPPL